MSIAGDPRASHPVAEADAENAFDRDTVSFLASLFVHVGLLLALGFSTYLQEQQTRDALTILAPVEEVVDDQEVLPPEEFFMNDRPLAEVGANSLAEAEMALSAAEMLSDISDVPRPSELSPVDVAKIEVNNVIEIATGLRIDNLPVRGAAGEGTTGATGAIDRITQDILLSLEERKTLVVWLFDQSGSLTRQRAEINERFDRIYQELGVIEAAGNPAFKRHDDKPLLTSVIAFGQKVNFLTDKPTDNLAEIKDAVAAMKQDDTGTEYVFTAIYTAVEKYRSYRSESPIRNIMLVVFTDEVGDDQVGLDKTVNLCRRLEVPVYVVGVPAPFGRDETLVKWVDPDPNYDQSEQWGRVSQGPESLFPERVKLRFMDSEDPDPMDSGFGPFSLTRLCYETGGIYFSVHPNRNVNRTVGGGETTPFSAHLKHFFDPEVMRRYRPDYLPAKEYLRQVNENKARASLLKTAQLSWMNQLESPRLRFVKQSEADLATALAEAQKGAAKLEPQLAGLYGMLELGEADRAKEASPRWQAGYDLAVGRVMAAKVRAEGYNAMLALAKRGLKFSNEKNNTWVLRHDDEISTGSQLAKAAQQAAGYLQRVVDEHPGTPWALLASRELKTPLGWKWTEEFTDLSPPPNRTAANNNNSPPRPARNDQKQMLKKPPPKRPVPKL
ncbi:MAG: VWA domain-containing protein [Planctomycetota bacterium]|nr:VWA domain-containing protein [Planctomycetota bacterium]